MPTRLPLKKTVTAGKSKSATLQNPAKRIEHPLTAASFIAKLKPLQSDSEKEKLQRYFKLSEGQYGEGDEFIGIKMGELFALAKSFGGLPLTEIEKLLESKIHEIRAGAISIMDKESRNKKVDDERLAAFFELYIRRHDRVNNWDLVDLGCLNMTGRYLYDKPRSILAKLARSKNLWERRTAILSTCYFIRQGETTDTFRIAALLLKDNEDLVQKAVGWMLRFAGDKNPNELRSFLDKHAAVMPRTMLRNAIEKFPAKEKEVYMKMKSDR